MQNPQIAGIMGKKTADRRAADLLGVESSGLVPYSLAKTLEKTQTKAASKLKNCTNNKEKRERIFHSLCFYPLPEGLPMRNAGV